MPSNGRSLCGASCYYLRAERVGERAYFLCRRCGQRYRAAEAGWTPGANAPPGVAVTPVRSV